MIKKIIISFLLVLGVTSSFANASAVSAAVTEEITLAELQLELMETADPETLEAMDRLDEYLIIDSDGESVFDLTSAVENDESDLLIEIGKVFNQFGEESKSNDGMMSMAAAASSGWPRIPIYGNYCGPAGPGGTDFTKKPIDNLDDACRYHDRCYLPGGSDNVINRSCNLAFMKRLLSVIQTSNKLTRKHITAVAAYKYFAGRL